MRDPTHEAELDLLAERQANESWPLVMGGQGRTAESVVCSGWWIVTLALLTITWILIWAVVRVVS